MGVTPVCKPVGGHQLVDVNKKAEESGQTAEFQLAADYTFIAGRHWSLLIMMLMIHTGMLGIVVVTEIARMMYPKNPDTSKYAYTGVEGFEKIKCQSLSLEEHLGVPTSGEGLNVQSASQKKEYFVGL